ncbi:MAG: tetratricopeptide repeat protein, partial [Desulfobacterales bacterium]
MKDKLRQGETLFAAGRIKEAEKCFLNIIEQDSQSKEALNNLGVISFQGHKIENAIDYFDRSLKLDPFYKDAVLNYAYILKELDLLHEASPYLNKIIKKYPNDKELKQLLNEIEMAQKPKRKIAVLCLPGLESFLGDIVDFLQTRYEVLTCYTNNNRDIEAAAHWADIVWIEWANQMAVHVTNKVPQIKDKKVICRLHGYEVFTDMPTQINWSVVDQLIFVAKHKQQIFNQKFKIQFQPQTILRNGINTNKFTIAENKQNTKQLVLLGHINFRKGLPLLLQFYHELLKHDPEYYLYIRGDFQDHRLEVAALTMINELSLNNKLEFV